MDRLCPQTTVRRGIGGATAGLCPGGGPGVQAHGLVALAGELGAHACDVNAQPCSAPAPLPLQKTAERTTLSSAQAIMAASLRSQPSVSSADNNSNSAVRFAPPKGPPDWTVKGSTGVSYSSLFRFIERSHSLLMRERAASPPRRDSPTIAGETRAPFAMSSKSGDGHACAFVRLSERFRAP